MARKIRGHAMNLELNDREFERLETLVKYTGYSKADILRQMILGNPIKAKPDADFLNELKQLNKIGGNLNQLSAVANATGFIDTKQFEILAGEINRLIMDIKIKYMEKEEEWQQPQSGQ